MWYVINLCEYLLKNHDPDLLEKGKHNAYRTVEYFKDFENEDGLLENLQSWNFIEWSKCNDETYIRGVNYPTNMLYAKMLDDMGNVYSDKQLLEKSRALKEKIIKQSFNGEFFEDNRLRDENGTLRLQGHLTETCQYYAFLTKVATKETFPALYETIRDCLGPRRRPNTFTNIGTPNIIPGLLARETVLLEYGEAEQVLSEVQDIFFVRAEHYQTLWEMVGDYASCNHGIAAYAGYLIIRALTGFNGYHNGKPLFTDFHARIDCDFTINSNFATIRVSVKNGHRTIESEPPKTL
jgi:alpha-L-rhamnosidase